MFKRRAGQALLGFAGVALLIGVIVTLRSSEAPRPQTLEFSVQCTDGSRVTEVRVETPNDEGRAEQTLSDPHNPHYGTFKYAVTDVNTQYSLQVTCVRSDTDPSVKLEPQYTLTGPTAAWGNGQHFGCSQVNNTCATLTSNQVIITVYCGWGVVATEVFVVPQVNSAGSAELVNSNIMQLYAVTLNTPVTPYSVQVTCKPKQGKAWTAKSDPNKPAIGRVSFSCGKPVGDEAGLCTHS